MIRISFPLQHDTESQCLEQNTKRVRTTVAGNRTACFCDVDFLKLNDSVYCFPDLVDVLLGNARVCNEEQICVDVRLARKFILYIFKK